MTEREVKQLAKLLAKFRKIQDDMPDSDARIGRIISEVNQWVKWYANDTLSVDL